jgi:hypothetical protein
MQSSEIKENFKYRLIANPQIKSLIIKTLQIFPDDIIKHISTSCWFISSYEDSWAFVLKSDDIKKDQSIIFLSDELLKESQEQIIYTIAHEIAHVILGHKNSIGRVQTKSEVKRQEKEAHEFVKIYFGELLV